jgi:catechol 2,3-dioxygenase-like lactoylglutathione lyase family enzyme
MKTQIAGFILRAGDKAKTADFYSKLGLGVHEHEHGGPVHFEILDILQNSVTEIYQKSEKFAVDALMIEVSSIDKTLEIVKEFGIKPKTDLKEVTDMKFIYINDPDGRDIMLIEKR